MAKGFIFSLCFLLVVNGCLAARQGRTSQQNQCQLNQLQAREPDNRLDAEAGQIETWNYNEDDFQCAGVAASRITIEQNGLHLPSYTNAPQLIYVVQGRGLLGTVLSGCPETYEESQEDQSQQQYQRGGRGQREQQEEQGERQREQERRPRQEQQQQQEERQREQERRPRQEQQQQQGGQRERQEEREERQEERQREQERRRRQQQQQQGQRGQEEQLDRHQKVRRIREGDVIAIPAGVAYWSYNDGQENLVAVSLLDLSNNNNQLDQNPRRFYLAGNPEDEFEQQGRSQQHRRQRGQSGQRGQRQQEEEEEGRREQQESQREREREREQQESRREREREQEERRQEQQQSRRSRRGQQQGNGNNVFSGFSTRLLAQALNVDEETARNLQGQDDNRNQIVRVRGQLDLVQPPRGQQQRRHEQRQEEQLERERQRAQQGGRNDLIMANGIEETLCSARLKENLQNPERADIYTPQAGRVSTLNSHNLPILRLLRLSAERGFFYNNAIYSPHWNLNAHSVVYVLRGDARVQVVNDNGDLILDDQVQEGQLFIVPQNHAVLKQAGNRGFEYIAFKTEDNAMINTLVGRTSVLRALPQEVVANAYQVSRQEALQLKYNRQETAALSSLQQGSSYERRAIA